MVKKFFQITRHSDREITSFLRENREKGYYLKTVKGNFFYFEKRKDDRDVIALTLYVHGRETSTALQVSEELVFLRDKGWDTICVGRQETISDKRRHVYLRSEVEKPEEIIWDERSEKSAQKRGRRKAISNLFLCILFLLFFFVLVSESLVSVVSSTGYIISFSLLFLFLLVSCVYSIRSFVEVFSKKEVKRLLDKATRIVFYFLIAFALFLLLDSFLSEKKSSERIKIGSSTYKLYSDDIPLTLEDLGASTDGKYRTTIKTESKSFIAQYSTYFDESFGVEEGESVYDKAVREEVSYISYSIFRAENDRLRRIIEDEIFPYTNAEAFFLSGADEAFRYGNNILIRKGKSIMVIRAGFKLSEDASSLLLSLLED